MDIVDLNNAVQNFIKLDYPLREDVLCISFTIQFIQGDNGSSVIYGGICL